MLHLHKSKVKLQYQAIKQDAKDIWQNWHTKWPANYMSTVLWVQSTKK